MAKKSAALPKDSPNRRSSRMGPVKSKVNKTSRSDGKIDIAGPLAPQGNKRTGKDFGPSTPPAKGRRPDGLGDEDSTRTGTGYVGARAHVHRTPGVEAQRMPKDLIETTQDADAPDVLNIP
jgi:hypothetical protein